LSTILVGIQAGGVPFRPVSESAVYESLHRSIVESDLSPGERLVEEEIADRLGSSRGAVRAALVHLSHDGLVVRERNRGAQVRRVTIDEAIEIVEACCSLESLAAGYAALRRTEPEADELLALAGELQRLQSEGELLAAAARNGELHSRILEVSGHHAAAEICGRLRSQVMRFQFRTVLAPGRAAKSAAEHLAIVTAIREQDRERAQEAMRVHLTHVAGVLADIAAGERQAS
jgi:DNA-binding GntR family transcriptional regulator